MARGVKSFGGEKGFTTWGLLGSVIIDRPEQMIVVALSDVSLCNMFQYGSDGRVQVRMDTHGFGRIRAPLSSNALYHTQALDRDGTVDLSTLDITNSHGHRAEKIVRVATLDVGEGEECVYKIYFLEPAPEWRATLARAWTRMLNKRRNTEASPSQTSPPSSNNK